MQSRYSGLLSAHDKLRIASFLKKMYRYGITSKLYNIDTLFGDADAILFKKLVQLNILCIIYCLLNL